MRHRWISEAELDANPQLVRSMSVQPPRRAWGACACSRSKASTCSPAAARTWPNTAEVGPVVVTKIEKKSAMTRRVVLGFAEPAAG